MNQDVLFQQLRPRGLGDCVFNSKAKRKLQAMLDTDQIMHMILFGTPGIGKSTIARILASADGSGLGSLVLNASSEEDLRRFDRVSSGFASTVSLDGRCKVLVVDEADRLPLKQQYVLGALMESHSSNCRFVLTTNHFDKIAAPIRSRCAAIACDVPFTDRRACIDEFSSSIHRRLSELGRKVDLNSIREIASRRFPDYRAIVNQIEFELIE